MWRSHDDSARPTYDPARGAEWPDLTTPPQLFTNRTCKRPPPTFPKHKTPQAKDFSGLFLYTPLRSVSGQ